jgi:oligopeptide transport system substrate-binding protein
VKRALMGWRDSIKRIVSGIQNTDLLHLLGICIVSVLLGTCAEPPWNNPYSTRDSAKPVLYASFSERPKHLDPVRAYSSNEYTFIAQIFEPPLQYHYLKRPYTLVTLTATQLPVVTYLDEGGGVIDGHVPMAKVAYSDYVIRIRSGIFYQPHPAFARDTSGQYRYHHLTSDQLKAIHQLSDFSENDSRELTAEDYVYQIKRLADPTLHSPIAGLMGEHIVGFKILSQSLARTRQARTETTDESAWLDLRMFSLPGGEVIDRYTYRIRLMGKYPQFRFWLAMPFFAPMPWEADRFYTQKGLAERNISLQWYPVGTGPYMLTENNPNRRMVLERNPNFHGEIYPVIGEPEDVTNNMLEDAGKPLPFIDKAIYSLEKESIPYWSKFLQGYYDSSGITSDSFDQAMHFNAQGEIGLTPQMQAKGIQLASAVQTSVFYMGFNMLDPLVGGASDRSRLLRRALSIAVDYEEFISIFVNGRGIAAQSPLAPGIFGYRHGREGTNGYVYEWVNGRPVRKSIEVARKLMAEAGYLNGIDVETGLPLVLYFDTVGTGPDAKARLNWMRKQFNKLGIQLVIRNTDYNRFQEKMSQGTAQIYQWGWNADYPDPENFLFLLYGPNGKVKAGGENVSNYENPEYDHLFERMKTMDDGAERQAIIDRMVDILRREAPWLFGFHPKAYTLYHAWYHNVKPNLMANNTLKYHRLEPALRRKSRMQWNQPVHWPLALMVGVTLLILIPAVVGYMLRQRSAVL